MHGAEYPSSSDSSLVPQSLNLTLICDPQATLDPEFVAYDGSRLDLKWTAPAGCPVQEEDGGDKDNDGDNDGADRDKEKESVGSGVGWFFLV